jgi:uncharacterized membrane protein
MAKASVLSRADLDRLHAKIAAAEELTSAELRVVVTRSSWFGIKNKARRLFAQYGLDKTVQRNAVMILVDTRSRELLIYGDEAVDERVDSQYWNDVRDAMVAELREGNLADGLATGIRLIGEKLASIFPADATRKNEIANDIIFA